MAANPEFITRAVSSFEIRGLERVTTGRSKRWADSSEAFRSRSVYASAKAPSFSEEP